MHQVSHDAATWLVRTAWPTSPTWPTYDTANLRHRHLTDPNLTEFRKYEIDRFSNRRQHSRYERDSLIW